jgi:dimethylargininase
MNLAITRSVSPEIGRCELTFVEREPIDYALAVEQHGQYCAMLQDCGLEVEVLPADNRYPDCSFVEDAAVVFDELAVIANMGTSARRGEEVAVERALKSHRSIVKMHAPATLDGGDVLQMNRSVFVGLSARTNEAGVEMFRRTLMPLGYQVKPVPVKECLHLKSACATIDDYTILANPAWVDLEPFAGIRVVAVPVEEPRAVDVLRLTDLICMHSGFPRTRELVEALGVAVRTVDLSEFVKAEAGPTCLSILLSKTNQQ